MKHAKLTEQQLSVLRRHIRTSNETIQQLGARIEAEGRAKEELVAVVLAAHGYSGSARASASLKLDLNSGDVAWDDETPKSKQSRIAEERRRSDLVAKEASQALADKAAKHQAEKHDCECEKPDPDPVGLETPSGPGFSDSLASKG